MVLCIGKRANAIHKGESAAPIVEIESAGENGDAVSVDDDPPLRRVALSGTQADCFFSKLSSGGAVRLMTSSVIKHSAMPSR